MCGAVAGCSTRPVRMTAVSSLTHEVGNQSLQRPGWSDLNVHRASHSTLAHLSANGSMTRGPAATTPPGRHVGLDGKAFSWKAAGASVVLPSQSPAKGERAKGLGADHVINDRENPKWGEAARAWTRDRGVDVAVEVGGPGPFDQSPIGRSAALGRHDVAAR